METQPNNVIGPITREDWNLLLYLKGSVRYMREVNAKKYLNAINKETKIYKETIEKYKAA